MENIDLKKLSDEEITKIYGSLAGPVLAMKRELEAKDAEIAEMHSKLEEAFNLSDSKAFKLLRQLHDRFCQTSKPDVYEEVGEEIKAGADEDYSDSRTEAKASKKKRGRKKGTKNLDGFDPEMVKNARTVILGTPSKDVNPTVFYKLESVTTTFSLVKYIQYPDADMPDQFGATMLTPSLGAYIVSRKFLYGIPLYRMESILEGMGVSVSRDQLSRYCITVADELNTLAERIKEKLTAAPKTHVIHADETKLDVIRVNEGKDKDGRPTYRKKQCRMFVYNSCRWEDHLMSVYRFEVDRKADKIKDHLAGFRGTVVCDDYAGYDRLAADSHGRVETARCWFHWKKRFEAISQDAEKAVRHSDGKAMRSYSDEVVRTMDSLFAIETECQGKTADELLAARQKRSKPIVDGLFERLKKDLPRMKSPIREATQYGLKIEASLRKFLDNAYIDMTNNLCERSVKNFVIDRKNFLFSYSEKGAEAAGTLMTVLRTARLNGLDPERYVEYVLKNLEPTPLSKIDRLLPWSEEIPKELRGRKELPKDLEKAVKEAEKDENR